MANDKPFYKHFKPAWRGFYKSFILMILVLVLAFCATHFIPYFNESTLMTKTVWIAAVVIDVILLLMVAVKRSMITLTISDNPEKKEEQEVDYREFNPTRPGSPDFRKSIQIGFRDIVDIKVGQTMMQTVLGIGDLIITSSGTGNEEIVARNLRNPHGIREEIQAHKGKYTNS